MNRPLQESSSPRRESLARKGRVLYGKYCGTKGRGICAESFACYHLDRGEIEVVHDLLAFLDNQIASLHIADPQSRLPMTEQLVRRIRQHLQANEPPTP